jgi:hypothetical protein
VIQQLIVNSAQAKRSKDTADTNVIELVASEVAQSMSLCGRAYVGKMGDRDVVERSRR